VTLRDLSLTCCALALSLFWSQSSTQAAYYPQTIGWSWTYSDGTARKITGARELTGRATLVMTHFFKGAPVTEDYLDFSQGVKLVGTAVGGRITTYNPPLLLLPPGPLAVGMRWSTTSTSSDGATLVLSASVTGVQGVRTPAGAFNALVIRQSVITSTGGASVVTLFFVPSVGTVRYLTAEGGSIDLIEMGR